MEDFDYNLNEPVEDEELKLPKKSCIKENIKTIILVVIIIFLSLVIITGITVYFTVLK